MRQITSGRALTAPTQAEFEAWYAGQPFTETRALTEAEELALVEIRRRFRILAAIALIIALLIVLWGCLSGGFGVALVVTALTTGVAAFFVYPYFTVDRALRADIVHVYGPARQRRDDGAAEDIRETVGLTARFIGPIVLSQRGDLLLAGGKADPSILKRKIGSRSLVARDPQILDYRRNLTAAELCELDHKIRLMRRSLFVVLAPLAGIAWVSLWIYLDRADFSDYMMLILSVIGLLIFASPILRIARQLPGLRRDHEQGEALREGDLVYLPNSRALWSRDGEPVAWRTSAGGGKMWSLVAETMDAH